MYADAHRSTCGLVNTQWQGAIGKVQGEVVLGHFLSAY